MSGRNHGYACNIILYVHQFILKIPPHQPDVVRVLHDGHFDTKHIVTHSLRGWRDFLFTLCIIYQSSQRSTLPPERPMNGERPERNRDRTGTGTTGTERPSVPFLAFLAFPVVPVHSSEKMERCLLKLSCYQTKRNLTFQTIQSDHSSRSNTYSKTVLS